jgi:Transcriptional regulator
MRVLDAGQLLIQSRGYNGFSYDDLARMLGITKASIHHHFRTKADLGATVVRRYTEDFHKKLAHVESTCHSGETRLAAYVELFVQTYAKDRNLCPGGMLSAESTGMPPAIMLEVSQFFDANLTWLTRLFAGPTTTDPGTIARAEELAVCLFSCLEGAMVVGRALPTAERSSGSVVAVGGTARAIFSAYLPCAQPGTAVASSIRHSAATAPETRLPRTSAS